ncbi:COG1520 FOG, WD40-like repeat [Burkholderiaceae bacterium]
MHTFFAERLIRAAAVLALSLSLASCGLFGADDRNKPTPLTSFLPGLSAQMAWKTQIGSGSGLGFAPTIVESSAYAATPDGAVIKVDLQTGSVVWRATVDKKLSAGVGSDGKITAVATREGAVVALDESGQVKWRAQATSDVSVPPIVGYGVVVVRSGDYRVQAFNAETGDRIWSVQRPGPALALRAPARMVMLEGLVVTAIPGGKLLGINAVSGDVQWEGTVAVPKGSTDLERVIDVVGAPVVLGKVMCAVSYQGRVVCFDIAAGGRPAWFKDFSSLAGLALDNRHVYAPSQTDVVTALSLKNGDAVWTQDALSHRKLTSPAAVGVALALGDFEGNVHFLAQDDGRMLARTVVGGGAIHSPLLATPQGVLVQTGDGALVMLALK